MLILLKNNIISKAQIWRLGQHLTVKNTVCHSILILAGSKLLVNKFQNNHIKHFNPQIHIKTKSPTKLENTFSVMFTCLSCL